MAKRKLTAVVLLEAAVLSMFSCPPVAVEATNSTIPGCPTVFGCVCVSPSDVTCNGVPAVVLLPLANMGLQEVPRFEGVYEDVRTIDLGNNSITRIRRASFTSTQFPNLVEIILINNRIRRVGTDAFQVFSLETLDLRENQLQEFSVDTFTTLTGPSFSSLLLEDNRIQEVRGVMCERFTREFFPILNIHLSGNTPPCEAEFFTRLCPFLEDGNATCIVATTEGIELLTIQPDVCMDLNIPEDGPDSNPNVAVIIGGAVGGVLGIILVILLLVLLVVCLRLKMWEKKYEDCAQSQSNLQQIPAPPCRPLGSDRPEQQWRVGPGAAGGRERIYEDIGLPSRPLPEIPVEVGSYDSNGYIFRVDSIPLGPTKQGEGSGYETKITSRNSLQGIRGGSDSDQQVSVLLEGPSKGARPQACEKPVTVNTLWGQKNLGDRKNKPSIDSTIEKKGDLVANQDDSKEKVSGKAKTPSNDVKKEGNSVYLQMIV